MSQDPNFDIRLIRNFSIIAHIDHGKSTLADRILEQTGAISEREMKDQVLDSMDIERERGITIKSQAVRVFYTADDGQTYQFNLIDTPGHVDFSYEVSRSLAACEGVLLIVDASQGVEAQTVANASMAMNAGLEIIPVINKIDLPAADPQRVRGEIEEGLAVPADEAVLASAKMGLGIHEALEAVTRRIPAPCGSPDSPLEALVFDSYFDAYRGVVALVKVVNGCVCDRDKVLFMATGATAELEEVGYRSPENTPCKALRAGEVGYLVTGIKDPGKIRDIRTGDTVTSASGGVASPLPGYRDVKPMVYTGMYPTDADQYPEFRDALDKLKLNDPSLVFAPETSHALGFGFRVGFLGLLHMEVVQERLEREFGLDLIATAPSVEYHVFTTDGKIKEVHSPQDLPDPACIEHIEEPKLSAKVIVPPDYIGAVMEATTSRRGIFKNMQYLSTNTVEMSYDMPLSELIMDFFDQLKSRTKGYASLDYELSGYMRADLIKLDILIAGKPVDALSFIIHREDAYERGRKLCSKLKEVIPRQLFDVPIQAAVGGRVLSRTNVKALRKDVLAKCYGGDISRKRKLLEKQKEGKRRMKSIGNVEIPQEAFMAILKVDS